MMLPGDVLICLPVVRTQGKKCPVGSVAYDKRLRSSTAKSPSRLRCVGRSIDSDILERLGLLILAVSSLISDFPKNISVPTHPKSDLELFASHPTRGAYHDRHGRGEGCGGRGSVLRAMGLQGGSMRPVSD